MVRVHRCSRASSVAGQNAAAAASITNAAAATLVFRFPGVVLAALSVANLSAYRAFSIAIRALSSSSSRSRRESVLVSVVRSAAAWSESLAARVTPGCFQASPAIRARSAAKARRMWVVTARQFEVQRRCRKHHLPIICGEMWCEHVFLCEHGRLTGAASESASSARDKVFARLPWDPRDSVRFRARGCAFM